MKYLLIIPFLFSVAFAQTIPAKQVTGLPGATIYVHDDGLSTGTGSTQATAVNPARLAAIYTGGEKIYLASGGSYTIDFDVKSNTTIAPYGEGAKPIINGTILSSSLTWTQVGTVWHATVASRVQRLLLNGRAEKTAQSAFYTITGRGSGTEIFASSATGLSNVTQMEMISKEYTFRWTYNTISAYNSGTGMFTVDRDNGIVGDMKFKLFNHPDLISVEGDWAWYNGIVYYKSPGNVNPNTLDVELSTYEEGIRIEDGATNVVIDGLEFYGSMDGIYGNDNANVSVTNCTFSEQQNFGVVFAGNSKSIKINNNILEDIGFTGIGGYKLNGFEINNNILNRIGVQTDSLTDPPFTRYQTSRYDNLYSANSAIIASSFSAYGTIDNNVIDSAAYTGIWLGGHGVKVRNNFVHKAMMRANDGGGIYLNGNDGTGASICYNVEITNNLVYTCLGAFEGAAFTNRLAYGIYLDNYATLTKVIGNTAYDNGTGGVLLGFSTKDNTVEGNVLYNNGYAQLEVINDDDYDANAYDVVGTKIANNTLVALNTTQYCLRIFDDQGTDNDVFASGGYAKNNTFINPYTSYPMVDDATDAVLSEFVTKYSQPFGQLDDYSATFVSEASAKVNVPLEVNLTNSTTKAVLPASFHNPLNKNQDVTLAPNQGAVFITGAPDALSFTGDNTLTGAGKLILPTSANTTNLRVGSFGVQSVDVNTRYLFGNLRLDGSDYKYMANGYGTLMYYGAGSMGFYSAPNGTAGNIATLTERLSANSSGEVKINNTYTLPTGSGSYGQVIAWPSSGTQLVWGNGPQWQPETGGISYSSKVRIGSSGAPATELFVNTPTTASTWIQGGEGASDYAQILVANDGDALSGGKYMQIIRFPNAASANAGDGIFYNEAKRIVLSTSNSGAYREDLAVSAAGNTTIGGQLTLNTQYTPSSSTDATHPNKTLVADDTYLYYRTSSGTWKKIAWGAF